MVAECHCCLSVKPTHAFSSSLPPCLLLPHHFCCNAAALQNSELAIARFSDIFRQNLFWAGNFIRLNRAIGRIEIYFNYTWWSELFQKSKIAKWAIKNENDLDPGGPFHKHGLSFKDGSHIVVIVIVIVIVVIQGWFTVVIQGWQSHSILMLESSTFTALLSLCRKNTSFW